MAIAPGNSDDPYDIGRLAKEIENVPLNDGAAPPLPDFTPLSADTALLTDADDAYDIDAFLLSRFEFSSLPELRSELRDFLAHLKESLVQLINDDYEAFISLSTDLQAEGARLERLKQPLGDIKAQVLVNTLSPFFPPRSQRELIFRYRRHVMSCRHCRMRSKPNCRNVLHYEKRRFADWTRICCTQTTDRPQAFLRQLIKISESVTRLESLLHITPPEDAVSSPTIRPAALTPEEER